MSAKRLAIETSTATGTVALAVGGRIEEHVIETAREQTDRVLGIIDALLGGAGVGLGDLDALVFGRGPGSFTGLRIAAAVVQGLSFAAGTPVVAVSSLAALAHRALGPSGSGAAGARAGHVLCCLDARMGEVYSGVFCRAGEDGVAANGAEALGPPEAVTAPGAPFVAAGDGFAAHAGTLAPVAAAAVRVEPALVPRARDLLALAAPEIEAGRFVALEAALPVYLRGPDAWRKSVPRKFVPGTD